MRTGRSLALGLLVITMAAGCAGDDTAERSAVPSPAVSTDAALDSPAPTGTGAVTPGSTIQKSDAGTPAAGPTSDNPPDSSPSSPGSAASPTPGAEMPPSVEGAPDDRGLPGLPASRRPLLRAPLPEAASARDALVPGVPRALRPLGRSRVITSSVSPAGRRLQVALEATTTASVDHVMLAYRTRLARLGMVEGDVAAIGESRGAAFSRAGSSVVVTVRDAGDGRTTYTVYGTLRVDG